jgi:hypothetical protein
LFSRSTRPIFISKTATLFLLVVDSFLSGAKSEFDQKREMKNNGPPSIDT